MCGGNLAILILIHHNIYHIYYISLNHKVLTTTVDIQRYIV